MVFRRGGTLRNNDKWTYKGSKIEVVNFYRYLGVVFTPKLSWSKTFSCLTAQAKKAIFNIITYQKKFGKLCYEDNFKVFDSMTVPILCYGAEILGTSYNKLIESIQATFCKIFLRLTKNTPNSMALGECGRLPLQHIYMTRAVRYWTRLIHLENNRLPHQAYIRCSHLVILTYRHVLPL